MEETPDRLEIKLGKKEKIWCTIQLHILQNQPYIYEADNDINMCILAKTGRK